MSADVAAGWKLVILYEAVRNRPRPESMKNSRRPCIDVQKAIEKATSCLQLTITGLGGPVFPARMRLTIKCQYNEECTLQKSASACGTCFERIGSTLPSSHNLQRCASSLFAKIHLAA
jgi:hypothetical protein